MEKANAPAVLADLVAYQDDSVVSKTLIEKKTGTVTLFAFDKGQGLSEHTAPFDAMVNVLDGTADISIAGNPLRLGTGEMVIMPATIPHALKATERVCDDDSNSNSMRRRAAGRRQVFFRHTG